MQVLNTFFTVGDRSVKITIHEEVTDGSPDEVSRDKSSRLPSVIEIRYCTALPLVIREDTTDGNSLVDGPTVRKDR